MHLVLRPVPRFQVQQSRHHCSPAPSTGPWTSLDNPSVVRSPLPTLNNFASDPPENYNHAVLIRVEDGRCASSRHSRIGCRGVVSPVSHILHIESHMLFLVSRQSANLQVKIQSRTPKGAALLLRPNIRQCLAGSVAYAAVAFLELLAHAFCSVLARLKGHSRPGCDRTDSC